VGHVIAIDGPAGAGKSTIARRLAEKLTYLYIDTGAMYRAIALWALREHIDPDDPQRLGPLAQAAGIELTTDGGVHLNGEDVTAQIRRPEISAAASRVAAIPSVRAAMVAKQQLFAEQSSVVMEGRDIGTVVFPSARVKIYLDADTSERVRRRSAEQPGVPSESHAEQIAQRDHRDRNREISPLIQAPDAVYIDSTGLTLDEVEEKILQVVRSRISNGKAAHE
jgi:cytidylate kinase